MNASDVEVGDVVKVYNVIGRVMHVFISPTGEEIYDVQHYSGRVAALKNDIVIIHGPRIIVP